MSLLAKRFGGSGCDASSIFTPRNPHRELIAQTQLNALDWSTLALRSTPAAIKFDNSKTRLRSHTPGMSVLAWRKLCDHSQQPSVSQRQGPELATWARNLSTSPCIPFETPYIGVAKGGVVESCADWALRRSTCASTSATAWMSAAFSDSAWRNTPRLPAAFSRPLLPIFSPARCTEWPERSVSLLEGFGLASVESRHFFGIVVPEDCDGSLNPGNLRDCGRPVHLWGAVGKRCDILLLKLRIYDAGAGHEGPAPNHSEPRHESILCASNEAEASVDHSARESGTEYKKVKFVFPSTCFGKK